MTRLLAGLLVLAGVAGCENTPPRPILPVDSRLNADIYDATLVELRKILIPKPGTTPAIDWSTRMYLNPVVLLPPADSANPLTHDAARMRAAVARGLVVGVCGKPPAVPCPADQPVAFTSLTPPWTMGGDTVYVRGGYTGEAPGERLYEGTFYVFTLAHDGSGELKVVRKSPPDRMTFESP
jgi:hypothetical protein